MSIATELENYRTGLTAAYAAAEAKGATIPEQKNLNNLSGAIESVPGGGGLIEYAVDENGKMSKATVDFKLPSNAKDLDAYIFYYAFSNNSVIKTADLSSLTAISGSNSTDHMFYICTNFTSVDLGSLTTISGTNSANGMFANCTNLTSADISALTTISGTNSAKEMFTNCGFTSVDLSSLTTISGSNSVYGIFSYCRNLKSVDFSSLTTISDSSALSNAFKSCTGLKELRFPALTVDSFGNYTNQFSSMLSGVTGCTLHFPAATQAKIETMTGYPNFSGTNTVVLFDL